MFEGTYVQGAESGVRKFDILEQEGSYDRILEMEFVNTQDGWVQYTTDGTDPLGVDRDGEVTLCHGKSAPDGKITLYSGTTTITARCQGSIKLKTGNTVVVHEPVTGTDGLFGVQSDRHSWSKGL